MIIHLFASVILFLLFPGTFDLLLCLHNSLYMSLGATFKESLGTFGDKYCGDTEIPFDFHLQSRDMIAAATAAAVAATAVAAAATAAATVAGAAVGTASAAAVVTAAASAAVATSAADCTTASVDSDSVASDNGAVGMQVPSPPVKTAEPPLPPAPPEMTRPKSANEAKSHDAQLRAAYREAMVWNQDAVTTALEVGSVDRTTKVVNAVSAFLS